MRASKPAPLTLPAYDDGEPATVQLYRCRLSLDELRDTTHPEVKFCDHCSRSVFRARDAEGLLQLVAADACVWVDDGRVEPDIGMVVHPD
jgi:hypothetical protein